jgi:hypothetical protein
MTVVSGQWSVVRRIGFVSCLLLSAFFVLSCSVPNLGDPDCEAARDTVREFYSWYFAADAEHRANSPEVFQKYVAPTLRRGANGEIDPFVLTNDFPKAFRVGECKVVEPGRRTQFEVLLFWKDDVRSEQRTIKVETENVGGRWLIRSITQ